MVCESSPEKYRHAYDDALYPVYLNHVSGKRGLSRGQVARLEKRFYNPEPAIVVNNRAPPRYLYERERKLPPPMYIEPELYRNVAVSTGPKDAPFPRSHDGYYRPRAYPSGDVYAPYAMEIRQRR